ncbi:GTPase IMAP family member 8-like [Poecilia formosa]|uniref:GTPase IMAP family member 8-like n=1 Tax=Poecilia formosa TaxID=48698 RepID=UPI0007B8AB72|nr:PREDICTED: GTPase IMAP family member 8-like [Poecilia formosa]
MAAYAHISKLAQSHPATELRIVLIGGRLNGSLSGKSSAGNIILGQNVFDTSRRTAQSEARQKEVFGRRVIVVDTPGWWWIWPKEETPKLDQIEIQNSVHLCPPGPHVFLLVIPVDLYLPQWVKASLKQHLKLFNVDVFYHTIMLITAVAPCSDEEVESRINTSPTLRWILQQCEDRKHFLNISDRDDKDQVKILLEKIETLIIINGFRHCSVDRSQGETLRKEMTSLTERASKRFNQMQKQRRKLRELFEGGKVPPDHLKIVMIGDSLAGKSSAGNILIKNAFHVNKNGRTTMRSEISHGLVEGRRLTVVDSPGWFCINTLQETSEMDKLEIENSVNLCPPGPHAVLLVIPVIINIDESYLRSVQQHMSLFREEIWKHTLVLFTYGDWLGVKTVEDLRSFTEKDLNALVEIMKPLTERVWRHCMVVFTWGHWLSDLPVENYIVREGKELQELLEKCGNRYHVLNPNRYSDAVQVKELFQKIINMVKQNKGCFTAESEQNTFLSFLWPPKQPTLTEKEWSRREQELVERMMKALAMEPEEPTEPDVRTAESKEGGPNVSGDVASDYGSISENRRRRGHDQAAEGPTTRVRPSEISSGIGIISSSNTDMENFDDSSEIREYANSKK